MNKKAVAVSYKVVAHKVTTDPYLRSVVDGKTEMVGRSFHVGGLSSWIQTANRRATKQKGQMRKGVAPNRCKSLARTSEHALSKSFLQEETLSTSTTNLVRIGLPSEMLLRTLTCVSQYGGKPRRRAADFLRREPNLGYVLLLAEEPTGMVT